MLSLKWLVCGSVDRPEEFEDLHFDKQAFELLVRLEAVFKHSGFTQDRYERFRCQPWT